MSTAAPSTSQDLRYAALLAGSADRGDPGEFRSQLNAAVRELEQEQGLQAAYNLVKRLEVALGLRKPTLALYDHTFHIIGGGEKYGFTVAHALQDDFDITILSNKEVTLQNIRDWYHLDLAKCRVKILPLPFFEELGTVHLDPARVSRRMANPFHIVGRESGNYDFFINNGMNEMVYPMADISSMIVHFPERRPTSYFYADRYTHIVYNSDYTAGWIEKKWKFKPHRHIYPPVDMESDAGEADKENIILSVARFESGGSKKQLEMIRTFVQLCRRVPGKMKDWKLVLAGGSHDDNPYLEKVRRLAASHDDINIELEVNVPGDRLKELYRKARIFWHLCGLNQSDPALVEHFGMTIVEAMQNSIVPIVFDGGGQREIVEPGQSGFRAQSTAQLIKHTLELVNDPERRRGIALSAFQRSKRFHRQRFEEEVKDFFTGLLKEYKTIETHHE